MTITRRAPARPLILALIAAMAIAMLPAGSAMAYSQDPASVWINEINYDNVGTDTGEAIEIAGPAGTSLAGWRIVLYNGANGAQYDSDPLTGTIPNAGGGYGAVVLQLSPGWPAERVARRDRARQRDHCRAVPQLRRDLHGSEQPHGDAGRRAGVDGHRRGRGWYRSRRSILALTGTGTTYHDFVWAAGVAASFGAPNLGQTFAPVIDARVRATRGGTLSGVEDYASVSRQISAKDPDDTVNGIQITSVTPANAQITVGVTTPAPSVGGTASATLSVGTFNPGTFQVLITAANDDAANPQTG